MVMSPVAILKLLKTAKDIHDYVKKDNGLDQQMEVMQRRVAKLEDILSNNDSNRQKIGKK